MCFQPPANSGALYQGIDHVQIEVWQGTMSQMFNRMVASGQVLDAGTHTATTREEWWYPAYVESFCPGLPDWRALKQCASIFDPQQTGGSGRYIAGPWEKPEAARIRALGLNFKVVMVTDADDLWLALTTLPLNEILDNSLAMVQGLAHDKGVQLSFNPGRLTVYANSGKLQQVMINLLTNAIKYNNDNGKITVHAKSLPPDQVEIIVEDTGIGIHPDDLPSIFEPLVRQAVELISGKPYLDMLSVEGASPPR